ncbi:MAG TPA: hypothetical protein VMX13_07100 [Sedimentisphaerales bacterium]|nr:hypothetical protein [Sedimentisphaerales bacterium]
MDTLEGIEKLAKRAQMQRIPAFAVSDQVMARLRFGEVDATSFAVFDFLAGIFATAASIIFYIGINAWMHIVSPLTQFFAPLQEVSLW